MDVICQHVNFRHRSDLHTQLLEFDSPDGLDWTDLGELFEEVQSDISNQTFGQRIQSSEQTGPDQVRLALYTVKQVYALYVGTVYLVHRVRKLCDSYRVSGIRIAFFKSNHQYTNIISDKLLLLLSSFSIGRVSPLIGRSFGVVQSFVWAVGRSALSYAVVNRLTNRPRPIKRLNK